MASSTMVPAYKAISSRSAIGQTSSRGIVSARSALPKASRSKSLKVQAVVPELNKVVETNVGAKSSLTPPMNFAGWAPEIINGRIAQIGFVAGIGSEIAGGETFIGQLQANPAAFFGTVALITGASFMPSIQARIQNRGALNSNPESLRNGTGLFNVDAEKLNGRAAMIGMVAIVATEYIKGSPLF